jgi:urease accessory protein UreF
MAIPQDYTAGMSSRPLTQDEWQAIVKSKDAELTAQRRQIAALKTQLSKMKYQGKRLSTLMQQQESKKMIEVLLQGTVVNKYHYGSVSCGVRLLRLSKDLRQLEWTRVDRMARASFGTCHCCVCVCVFFFFLFFCCCLYFLF